MNIFLIFIGLFIFMALCLNFYAMKHAKEIDPRAPFFNDEVGPDNFVDDVDTSINKSDIIPEELNRKI